MNRRSIILLILIVCSGFLLRVWKVEEIPPGVNRDEASLGYTAYSILKTGRDEYGVLFPLSIKSFGDWKLPLYVYLDIIPVKLFSLTEFSVRLPSVFFGTLTILVFYFLILELMGRHTHKKTIALAGAFSLSVSPWHIHFSRVASEANIAVFLVSFGFYLFIKGIKNNFLLAVSAVVLALSLYTYHGNHIFTPLFFIILVCKLIHLRKDKKTIGVFILPFIILATLIFAQTVFSADKTKISGLLTTSDTYLVYDKVNLSRLEHDDVTLISTKAFHNKIGLFLENFIYGYVKGFSPEFLFIKGGGNLQHNIPDFGNLYILESVFIILGVYFLFARSYPWRWLILLWVLIAPLPAAITRDAPHSARMLAILPLPYLLSAIGFVEIISGVKPKRILKVFTMLLVILFSINISVYLDRYFVHFSLKSEFAWGGGYKKLVQEVGAISNQYNEILMDRPDYSPYIYFLFYNQTDPQTFQRQVVRYPEDNEGFQHVKAFQNITFKKIDWVHDVALPDSSNEKKLLVSWAESTSVGLNLGDRREIRLIKKIHLKNGSPQFYLIELNNLIRGNSNNE